MLKFSATREVNKRVTQPRDLDDGGPQRSNE
ncbi:hypothetical protein QE454_003428 [Microbacterium sp. SORGH_AS454]|nr:hypothetical protein [Microbacterium sp. SORGH_AS_0454]